QILSQIPGTRQSCYVPKKRYFVRSKELGKFSIRSTGYSGVHDDILVGWHVKQLNTLRRTLLIVYGRIARRNALLAVWNCGIALERMFGDCGSPHSSRKKSSPSEQACM
ncbi:MAG: hypothetical protein Q8M65_10230, partial [Rhodoglobus sp.]|nr:hypothetical protein [Rhodoglobus sp.]